MSRGAQARAAPRTEPCTDRRSGDQSSVTWGLEIRCKYRPVDSWRGRSRGKAGGLTGVPEEAQRGQHGHGHRHGRSHHLWKVVDARGGGDGTQDGCEQPGRTGCVFREYCLGQHSHVVGPPLCVYRAWGTGGRCSPVVELVGTDRAGVPIAQGGIVEVRVEDDRGRV